MSPLFGVAYIMLWFFLVLYERSGCGTDLWRAVIHGQPKHLAQDPRSKTSFMLDSCRRTYRADVVYKRYIT